MKIKRHKKVNKNISFYVNHFGFRPPYQVLIDGTFCLAALNNQIDISDNIPRYLQAELKLITTQCTIIEMENLSYKLRGALHILKKYLIHKCGHEKKPISASKCILSMLGKNNENHYIIASQDKDLQDKLRERLGVPLLYLHGKAPVLEQPSPANTQFVSSRQGISTFEREAIDRLKEASGLKEETDVYRKKKKKKGPNPLSCKKKKTKTPDAGKVVKKDTTTSKKKRKRVKIPDHVKEILSKGT